MNAFTPVIEESLYRRYVLPGMHTPWTPSSDDVRWEWEDDHEKNDTGDEGNAEHQGSELRI